MAAILKYISQTNSYHKISITNGLGMPITVKNDISYVLLAYTIAEISQFKVL